jgi:hypothetical protein
MIFGKILKTKKPPRERELVLCNQPKLVVPEIEALKWRHLQSDHYPHSHPENVSYEPNKYAGAKVPY